METKENEVAEMNGITSVKMDAKKSEIPDKMETPLNKMDHTNNVTKMVQIEATDKIDEMKPEKPSKPAIREVTINADETPSSSSSSSSAISHSQELAARRRQFMSQPSTVATRRQQAVCVRRAHKSYGPKNNPNIILDGLNMTVPKGSIYGLLGASGCGKTTLLSCIVGRRRLNSGEIWVLGGTPGSRGSGVPGPRIGYMPQELALYGEFTLRETLLYFGWIAGMTTSEVDEKIDFLIRLLQLPNVTRFVKNLSGGQQRRMSLAAALLHEPELLILDEPTVGVDPIIRQSIWDHLVDITNTSKKTVIITTHYIEETRQAHIIGLMRGGKFLAEESPDALQMKYQCNTLEEVFLKLSIIQNKGKRRRSSIAQEISDQVSMPSAMTNPALDITEEDPNEISGEFGDHSISIVPLPKSVAELTPPLPPSEDQPATLIDYVKVFKPHHMKALIWKNFLWMWRNVGVMLFIIGLPCLQIILFCLAIGHDPKGLKLAVSNHEINGSSFDDCPVIEGCNYTLLSCRYLNTLKKRDMVIELYDSDEAAYNEVQRGRAWATMIFKSNYSESLIRRTEDGRDVADWDIEASDIEIRMDMSNQQIGQLLFRDIQLSFFSFINQVLTDCEVNPSVAKIPVRFNKPIYGNDTPNFTDFAAPGVILTIIFFLSVALTSGAMLIERNEGMLERCLVSGITGIEMLFSHVVTQFVIMSGQTTFVLLFSFSIFGLTLEGEILWVILLTILTGLCGMCFGFVVSSACENERTATYMAMGSFLPIVMLCGIIWPIEGMYPGLKYLAYFLPLTKSTECLRSITQRGWPISEPAVYSGFISTGIWVLIFLTISILLLKFKKG
ncbi:ABC transporter G family member 23 isoform X2 [Contarinia nasturtii]|nr:ABC transporter G family member 23 isoform X2 [Contarinia nasturtii]XP_031629129.1 ABC transporter G family member 23 isoform X2 [Contarinia nasturtii]XP_031629130.1 ABC transporter G family member 23 isoform X2 [Contarinia nasturtii]XP_031629131.1 ABC transporter G family member 23 isoform X2 [Contarinia nasturtii]XP_031629132.1 ABC transporter G family member 23 isoform X2 [Contarinia nasturtii]XP_031629133.1 ABC transporter G family member 23 isoform X2 [Contarinia nasturtii]